MEEDKNTLDLHTEVREEDRVAKADRKSTRLNSSHAR